MEHIFPAHFIVLPKKEFFYEDKEVLDHVMSPLNIQSLDGQRINKLRYTPPKTRAFLVGQNFDKFRAFDDISLTKTTKKLLDFDT